MTKRVALAVMLVAQVAGADSSKIDKYGMVVIDSKELVSKVSLVSLTGSSPEAVLRGLHTIARAKEPIALDDDVKDSQVWMFGTPIAKTKVKTPGGDLALRIEFVGLGGTENGERLGDVVRPAHLVVLVLKGDESADTVDKALAAIKPHLRPDRADQLCLWLEKQGSASYSAPVIGVGKNALLPGIVRTISSGKSPGK